MAHCSLLQVLLAHSCSEPERWKLVAKQEHLKLVVKLELEHLKPVVKLKQEHLKPVVKLELEHLKPVVKLELEHLKPVVKLELEHWKLVEQLARSRLALAAAPRTSQRQQLGLRYLSGAHCWAEQKVLVMEGDLK